MVADAEERAKGEVAGRARRVSGGASASSARTDMVRDAAAGSEAAPDALAKGAQ